MPKRVKNQSSINDYFKRKQDKVSDLGPAISLRTNVTGSAIWVMVHIGIAAAAKTIFEGYS